jgi:hypothetical protein
MKKMLYLFLLIPLQAYAPSEGVPGKSLYIERDILLESIIVVECGRDSTKINYLEDAVGILQIRPVMVREANRIVGFDKYSLQDRTNTRKSIQLWYDVQDYWNPEYEFVKACKLWNAGDTASLSLDALQYTIKVITQYDKAKKSEHRSFFWEVYDPGRSGRMVSLSVLR